MTTTYTALSVAGWPVGPGGSPQCPQVQGHSSLLRARRPVPGGPVAPPVQLHGNQTGCHDLWPGFQLAYTPRPPLPPPPVPTSQFPLHWPSQSLKLPGPAAHPLRAPPQEACSDCSALPLLDTPLSSPQTAAPVSSPLYPTSSAHALQAAQADGQSLALGQSFSHCPLCPLSSPPSGLRHPAPTPCGPTGAHHLLHQACGPPASGRARPSLSPPARASLEVSQPTSERALSLVIWLPCTRQTTQTPSRPRAPRWGAHFTPCLPGRGPAPTHSALGRVYDTSSPPSLTHSHQPRPGWAILLMGNRREAERGWCPPAGLGQAPKDSQVSGSPPNEIG